MTLPNVILGVVACLLAAASAGAEPVQALRHETDNGDGAVLWDLTADFDLIRLDYVSGVAKRMATFPESPQPVVEGWIFADRQLAVVAVPDSSVSGWRARLHIGDFEEGVLRPTSVIADYNLANPIIVIDERHILVRQPIQATADNRTTWQVYDALDNVVERTISLGGSGVLFWSLRNEPYSVTLAGRLSKFLTTWDLTDPVAEPIEISIDFRDQDAPDKAVPYIAAVAGGIVLIAWSDLRSDYTRLKLIDLESGQVVAESPPIEFTYGEFRIQMAQRPDTVTLWCIEQTVERSQYVPTGRLLQFTAVDGGLGLTARAAYNVEQEVVLMDSTGGMRISARSPFDYRSALEIVPMARREFGATSTAQIDEVLHLVIERMVESRRGGNRRTGHRSVTFLE